MNLKFQIRILKLLYGHGDYGVKLIFLIDYSPRFSIKFWRWDLDFTLHLHWVDVGDNRWFKTFWQKGELK